MRVQRFFGSAAMMCGQHRNIRSDVEAAFAPKHWAEFTAAHGKAWDWERILLHHTFADLLTTVVETTSRPTPTTPAEGTHRPSVQDYLHANALFDHLRFLCLLEEQGTWPQKHNPATTLHSTDTLPWLENKNAGDWVFSGDNSPRMVRPKVYGEVWDALEAAHKDQSHYRGIVIKGHPGTGKTYFLDTLLSWSLFTYPQVPVLAFHPWGVDVFTNLGASGEKRYRMREDPHKLRKALLSLGIPAECQLLVLHDIKSTKLSFQLGPLHVLSREFNIVCVLASPPDERHFKDFSKEVAGYYNEILLPTLSFDETSEFLRKVEPNITDQTIEDRFYKVGGVPCNLCSDAMVNAAVLEQKLFAPSVKFMLSRQNDYKTYSILQMIPNADGPCHLGFVSDHACKVWLSTQEPASISKLLQHLKTSRTGSVAPGLLFEQWFLSALMAASSLSWRRLAPADGPTNHYMEQWRVPQNLVREVIWATQLEAIEAGKLPILFQPASDQFPVVDAVLVGSKDESPPEVTLFQVTVAAKSRPKKNDVQLLLDALAKNGLTATRLVWVVDSSSALNEWQELDSGTLAAYSKIPQYLCRWDDNMCWVQLEGSGNDVVAFPCAPGATENEILSLVKKYVDPTAREFTNFTTSVRSELKPLIFRR